MHIAPFIAHNYIVRFVIEFSRNSHISDSVFTVIVSPPLCVHTSHRICTNLRMESRAGCGGSCPPSPPVMATVMVLNQFVVLKVITIFNAMLEVIIDSVTCFLVHRTSSSSHGIDILIRLLKSC